MNPLYVGIDVSSLSNVAYFMLPDGSKHSTFSLANSRNGAIQLVKRIFSAVVSHSLDTVLIGLESTSVYGDNLVYFLREDATLVPFNKKIHVLNPKQVSKFKEVYNEQSFIHYFSPYAYYLEDAEGISEFVAEANSILCSVGINEEKFKTRNQMLVRYFPESIAKVAQLFGYNDNKSLLEEK